MSSPVSAVSGWLQIALTTEPLLLEAVKAVRALFRKYPALTPDQLQAMLNDATLQADASFDHVLQQIQQDQAKPPA